MVRAPQTPPHLWHFGNMDVLPPSIEGVRVLHGMEANVMDFSGRLDLPEERFFSLDLVIASMHLSVLEPGSAEACTAAYLALAENPEVDIIGHSGTPAFRYDYESVIPAFGRSGKIVEINETTFRARSASVENCRRIGGAVQRARRPDSFGFGCPFPRTGGPDAPLPGAFAGDRFPSGARRQRQRGGLFPFLNEKHLTL